jgi:hypothetical protein
MIFSDNPRNTGISIQRAPRALVFWIFFSTWAILSGWILSIFGQLNITGYILASTVALGGWFVLEKKVRLTPWISPFVFHRIRWRLSHAFPLIYTLLLLMILLGGILYSPSQYDALAYRIPRMLHWLQEGGWHWIHTNDQRMNLSAVGFEWMSMPLLVFTHAVRWFWVLNFTSFALLPGLVFALFRSVGVSPRASWSWMWLLPSGFCFVTQAGSIGNDLTSVPFAIGSVYFAVRARRGCFRDLVLAILCSGLVSGMKASNIPLLLPAFIAGIPSLRLLFRHPFQSTGVLVMTAAVSFMPMAVLNHLHTGKWTGSATNRQKMELEDPVAGLIGNGVMITVSSFQPPILPMAGMIADRVDKLLGKRCVSYLKQEFPKFSGAPVELPLEECSGMGLGITLSFLSAIILQLYVPYRAHFRRSYTWLVLISAFIALGVYMIKMGNESVARLLQPYYPICLAGLWLFFVRKQDVVRFMAWRWIAVIAMLMAIPVLILSPARPLWPAQSFLEMIDHDHGSRMFKRAVAVYSVYHNRNMALSPVVVALPHDAVKIGFAGSGGDLETSLWWPMGSRKIVHVIPGDDPAVLKDKGVEVLCSNSRILSNDWKMTPEEFAKCFHGEIIARPKATETVVWGEEEWVVIDLRNGK